MKTFICNNCQSQVRRPTAPLRCDACGAQRIGLFRVAPNAPAAPLIPPAPSTVAPPRSPETPIAPLGPPAGMQPPRPMAPPAAPPNFNPPPTFIPTQPFTQPTFIPQQPLSAPPTFIPPPEPAKPAAPIAPTPPAPKPPAATPVSPAFAPPADPAAQFGSGPSLDDAQAPTASWKRPGGRIPTGNPAAEQQEPPPPRRDPPPSPPAEKPRAATPPAQAKPPSEKAPEKAPAPKPAAQAPPAKPPEREKPQEKPAAEKAQPAAEKPQPARTRDQVEPGTVIWKHPSGSDRAARQPLRNCPAVGSDGRIYAALGASLVALSERDGGIYRLWEYNAKAHIPGSPAIGSDNRIRVHSGDGKLHCVNLSGESSWEPIAVGEPLGWASPVIDGDGNTFVCNYRGGLLKIDSQGTLGRNPFYQTRQKFDSTPLLRKNLLYVGSEDGFVYAMSTDGSRGRLQWDPIADQGKTGWFVNSAPAPAADGGLVVAGRDEHLYMFAPDGKVAWKTHIRGQVLASPVVGLENEIYVGVSLEKRGDQSKGRLVCIDPKSKRSRWDFEVSKPVETTPVIGSDGVVYFGDNSGTIHAITPEGRRLWHQNVGSPVRSAGALAGKRRLLFGLDNGQLLGLECSSPELAKTGWPKYMGTLGQSGGMQ